MCCNINKADGSTTVALLGLLSIWMGNNLTVTEGKTFRDIFIPENLGINPLEFIQ